MSHTNGKIAPRRDYRHHCNRLLFRGSLAVGTKIQIRCPKCGLMHVIDVRPGKIANGQLTEETGTM